MVMAKKLYRSRTDSMIAGVCGGLGAYFNVDPTIIRVLFVLSFLFSGAGILVYLALWLIVPQEGPEQEAAIDQPAEEQEMVL
jgi:phage shock protein C